jgi:aconitate hydratase
LTFDRKEEQMADNLTYKILRDHLVDGELKPGAEIGIRIDQTLTQDATGTMAYLQFEAMGLDRVKTKLSVSYVDHNMLQTGFENADDHLYLQSVASNYGIYFSKPGNGICHQVHLERFSVPGCTLLGSDSHTPTSGGAGMIAIGAGGLDVAVAMGGGAFYLPCPHVVGIHLTGKLQPWVTGKDVILEVLRQLTVKGGVGNIIEYHGEGVKSLTLTQRATITNMGAELGATTSIFPSDENTRVYFKAQSREKDYKPLAADPGASYDKIIEIDLSKLEPMIAKPHSPDSVVKVREVAGTKAQQVCVGSCTNSSLYDLEITAAIFKGKQTHPELNLTVTPGSKQVYKMVADSGAMATLIAAGARILESACGPCIGMGQAPASGSVSVRSFNRNFEGRSGTKDSYVYLASAETCAATALTGVITDPRDLGAPPTVTLPEAFYIDDRGIIPPAKVGEGPKILRGPNIKPLPTRGVMPEKLSGKALLKLGDNISTDHIMPAGAKILPLRSNIPAISEFVFFYVDQTFPKRAKDAGSCAVVGGENYGQGSSREHAALAPMYLGLQFVLTKSFARIHKSNLVNFGILPLTFANAADYDRLKQDDQLEIPDVRSLLPKGNRVTIKNVTQGYDFEAQFDLSPRQVRILLAGGLLNFTKAGEK